ncbi:MAG: substrate-binding domain-containing protein [Brumimicrobium sp.]|nr:substrate-binding domain-containing protein [Brumimicrobium sp.]
MMKLKIGGVPEHFNLPWKLAMEEGKFREEDIHLHWEDMAGGTGQMIRGLENNTLDVAVLLTEGITRAILQGLDARILNVYVSSSLHWGIHVPFESAISSVNQLEGKTFAISREGSGSHLMSYVLADQKGWNVQELSFNIVGDVYGGLWALQNNEAQAFLWEKYTTKPYADQKKCRYIDEVVTPWPCFVIAVRREIIDIYGDELDKLFEIVRLKARELKINPDTVDIISWRYGLKKEDVRNWLKETDWNYGDGDYSEEFDKTVKYLLKLQLITESQAQGFETKLFVK